MFSSERSELRKIFFAAWQKHRDSLPVEPLEAQIIEIILQHPEYQVLLTDQENQHKDFFEENPFLHMSLHLALQEQIKTDRPSGIKQIYQILCQQFLDTLIVEHKMMECLEQILWEAQHEGKIPSEELYLNLLKAL